MSRGRPIVGITTYAEPVDRGDWRAQASVVLPHSYVAKVEAAGGIALLIPPRADADDDLAADVLSRVDALLLAGGADLDPARYGAQPHALVQDARPDRDALELALARVSGAVGLPTLGICRGMQVLAVASGGTLEQHIPDRTGTDVHSTTPGVMGAHPVRVLAGTRLAAILGADAELSVPTYHHQAVATHPGYAASAWHADGTLEAMEDAGARFRLAVQWHPEAGDDPRLFAALVDAARR